MRDIEATLECDIQSDGTINFRCEVPLAEHDMSEFNKVLKQGSGFMTPILGENTISFSHSMKYENITRARERIDWKINSFSHWVVGVVELTLPDVNLYLAIPD